MELKDDLLILRQKSKKIKFLIPSDNDGIHLGFLRSAINEFTNINISIIILNKNNDINDVFLDKLLNDYYDYNTEYYITEAGIQIKKLNYSENEMIKSNKYYFNIHSKGNFNSFGFYPILTNNLPENFVEIDVKACALNFKDVMVSLGVINEDYIGYELSGIIKQSNSKYFKVGDRVLAAPNIGGKGICNNIICHENYVWQGCNNLSFNELASISLIFGTVYVCLIERAKIKEGDKVLIHSATGGIGMAAIQLCKIVGAEIYATAGTDEKRKLLKDEYGIKFISNSRNHEEYKKDILNFTNGKGVNVILNSLAGDFLKLILNFWLLVV